MPASPLPLGTIALDSGAELPLYRQLYDALREAILEGRLHPGARLPSSRTLAGDLGVGRHTVLAAYDQLTAEGYLEGQVGAGTLVAATLPDSLLQLDRQASPRRTEPPASNARTLSKRGEALSASRRLAPAYKRGLGQPFQHGLPAIDEFPAMLWSRLLARHSRDTRNGHFGYEVGFGVPALREAIAAYAGAARGVVCSADQVIVTVGAQGALDLTARMLLDPGDPVWIEEPGYLGARGALAGAGAQLTPVPVDAEGIDVEAGIARQPSPKLIYVTPSHQFPLGATLSLPRRLALPVAVAAALGGQAAAALAAAVHAMDAAYSYDELPHRLAARAQLYGCLAHSRACAAAARGARRFKDLEQAGGGDAETAAAVFLATAAGQERLAYEVQVRFGAELGARWAGVRGVADPGGAAVGAVEGVGIGDAADRRVKGFSHGMRQRVKIAQALAHQPELLLLDEPLNGLDPAQRREVVTLIQRLGEQGRTVLVSSHVLHEVERMAPRVLVLVNGHLVASGATAAIRALIADRPRSIRLEVPEGGRELARELVGAGLVEAVRFDDGSIVVESADLERFSRALPTVARGVGARLRRVEPVGDDLESVYTYLHQRARGVGR